MINLLHGIIKIIKKTQVYIPSSLASRKDEKTDCNFFYIDESVRLLREIITKLKIMNFLLPCSKWHVNYI